MTLPELQSVPIGTAGCAISENLRQLWVVCTSLTSTSQLGSRNSCSLDLNKAQLPVSKARASQGIFTLHDIPERKSVTSLTKSPESKLGP